MMKLILWTLLCNLLMMLMALIYVGLAAFSAPVNAETESWPVSMPWRQPSDPPPNIKPFELPTLKGRAPHFNTPISALRPAPVIDPDAVFYVITNCYPEKSKFKVDVSLVAGVKSNLDQYGSSNWPDISEHYIGIVGEMPLYSTTEQARERQWEHKRRTETATNVANFAHALANRNHAYREMGMYLAMEARARSRVKQGIANVTEQLGFLEKVAAAQRDILTHEATIVEKRLALLSMCDNQRTPAVNQYLKKLAVLPVAAIPAGAITQ